MKLFKNKQTETDDSSSRYIGNTAKYPNHPKGVLVHKLTLWRDTNCYVSFNNKRAADRWVGRNLLGRVGLVFKKQSKTMQIFLKK